MPESPEDLENHQLIVFMNAKRRKLQKKTGEDVYFFPPSKAKPRVICDDGTNMKIATCAGIGISMNSFWNVAAELKAGALIRFLTIIGSRTTPISGWFIPSPIYSQPKYEFLLTTWWKKSVNLPFGSANPSQVLAGITHLLTQLFALFSHVFEHRR